MRLRMFLPLAAALVLLAAPAVRAEPDEDRVHDELRKVFERPEFNPEKKDREASGFSRWLGEFFGWLGSLHASAPVLYWLVLIGCIGLLVLLLIYLGVVIRRAAYVRRDRDDGSPDAEQRRQRAAGLRTEADLHADAGEYTAAIRCLFLSLIYAFDESGRLLFQPALTNREYMRGFANRTSLESGLRPFVDILDDNWYGQRPTTEEQYREFLTLYERLRKQA